MSTRFYILEDLIEQKIVHTFLTQDLASAERIFHDWVDALGTNDAVYELCEQQVIKVK